jgi:hypothetical protein
MYHCLNIQYDHLSCIFAGSGVFSTLVSFAIGWCCIILVLFIHRTVKERRLMTPYAVVRWRWLDNQRPPAKYFLGGLLGASSVLAATFIPAEIV